MTRFGAISIGVLCAGMCCLPSARADEAKLKVATAPFLSYAPIFIAEESGHFRDQGISVEFVRLTGNTDALPLLVQGRIDVVPGFMAPGLFNLMARGADIRFVADKGHVAREGCVYRAVLARRELVESGRLDRIEQIRGLRIAAERTSPSYFDIDQLLTRAGMRSDDVEIVDVPYAAKPRALETGAIDLTAASEPWITRMVDAGDAVVWRPMREIVPDFQHSYVLFGPRLLRKDRDVGVRFVAAYLLAVRQYNEGKTARNVEIIAHSTGLDPDLIERSCWPPIRESGEMNLESVADYQKWALERGLLDRLVPVEGFWDGSFLEAAAQLSAGP